MRADQRNAALSLEWTGAAITEPEREVLPAVDETVEAEHSGEW